MKKILALIAGILTLGGGVAYTQLGASNNVSYTPDLYPITDSQYYVGTTTKAYKAGSFDELCLAGSCQSSWSAGSYPDYLSQVGDVSTTTLATGYVLKWSGTEWESVATSSLNITAVGDGTFSTTSADYWANGSTTIPKTYTANTFTALQTFDTASFSNLTVSGTATTTALCFASGQCMTQPTISGSNITMYHWNGASDTAGYEMFRTYPDNATTSDESCTATAGYCASPIDSYISTTTDLRITSISAGTWNFHYWTYVDSIAGVSELQADVYRRTSLGVETLLFTATSSEINSTSITETDFSSAQGAFDFDVTDRLVVKVRGWTSSGAAITIHFIYGGTQYYSHVETPIMTADLDYAVKSANETITGAWTHTATTTFATTTTNGRSINLGQMTIGTSTNPLATLHIDSGVTTDVDALFAEGTINNYYQFNIKNRSAGTSASTDIVATQDTGSELTGYIDMGINSSGYTAGIVGNANDSYIYGSSTGNMLVGSPSTGKDLIFFTGATNAYTNERMRILSTGNIGIGTTSPYSKLSVNGQVVASNFVATTTAVNTFPNASTTNLTVATNSFLGTVRSGTWNGSTIGIAYGGTNATSLTRNALLAFNGTAVVGSTTAYANNYIATSTSASSSFAGGFGIGSTSPSVQFSLDGVAGTFLRIYNSAKLKIMEIADGVVTLLGTWDFSGATVKQHTYPAFSYASSTAFIGTTTIPIGTARNAQAFNSVQCFTDTSFTDIYITDGTNRMNWFQASTTAGTVTLSTNNTFTAGEKRYIEFGNATSTKQLSCSFDITVNN